MTHSDLMSGPVMALGTSATAFALQSPPLLAVFGMGAKAVEYITVEIANNISRYSIMRCRLE